MTYKINSALSQKICQHCFKREGRSWLPGDDAYWSYAKRVICPTEVYERFVSSLAGSIQYTHWKITPGRHWIATCTPVAEVEILPPWCPYVLEHFLEAQNAITENL